MPRQKKDGKFVNFYIDRELAERFDRYADDRGQTKTVALERILKEYLDAYDQHHKIDDSKKI